MKPAQRPDHGERALGVARRIRGELHPPVLMLHGAMPRSGTVYTGELLRLHPAIAAYPHDLWETPFLRGAGHLRAQGDEFFHFHDRNRGKMGGDDLMMLAGSAFVGFLHEGQDPAQVVLVKAPNVVHLEDFPAVFPFERCLILIRDGRDVVDSTLRTWPERYTFEAAALEWAEAARNIKRFMDQHPNDPNFWCVRYEDILDDPESFVRDACHRLGLDPGAYPFAEIPGLPVRGSSRIQVDGNVSWTPRPRPEGFRTTGHWSDWTEERAAIFERVAGETLREAGYGLEGEAEA